MAVEDSIDETVSLLRASAEATLSAERGYYTTLITITIDIDESAVKPCRNDVVVAYVLLNHLFCFFPPIFLSSFSLSDPKERCVCDSCVPVYANWPLFGF